MTLKTLESWQARESNPFERNPRHCKKCNKYLDGDEVKSGVCEDCSPHCLCGELVKNEGQKCSECQMAEAEYKEVR